MIHGQRHFNTEVSSHGHICDMTVAGFRGVLVHDVHMLLRIIVGNIQSGCTILRKDMMKNRFRILYEVLARVFTQ